MNIQADWSELCKNIPWVESPDFEKLLASKVLSPRDRQIAVDMNSQGFAVVEGLLSDDLIDRIKRDSHLLFNPKLSDGPRSSYRCMDGWKESSAIRNLAIHPEILNILRMLYEREPVPFQTLNFLKGSQQRTHSDTIHFSSLPVRYMCGVWVALEDATEQNGPLHYYEGSHKLQDYDLHDLGLVQSNAGYGGYEDAVEKLMKEQKLERKIFTIKRGAVGFWAANLFHGGTPILDPGSTRQSQVNHYFFENCIYYSPVFSDRKKGELFLNDFDIKLNIRTLRPIRPNLNGAPMTFQPIGQGRYRVLEEGQFSPPWKESAKKEVLKLKSRVAIPWRRMKMTLKANL